MSSSPRAPVPARPETRSTSALIPTRHTRCYVNAVIDFGVPYDEDIPGILAHLKEHVMGLRPQHDDILADPEFVVQELLEATVLIRCVVRVKPSRDDAVAEVVRAELLIALTARGVALPACRVVRLREGARAPQLLAASTEGEHGRRATGQPE